MKKKRYSEEQIFKILQEGNSGGKITDICRKHGISEQTFHRWKGKYKGLNLSDLRKMKEMEGENARMKKIIADQALQIDALKEVLQGKF